MQHNAQGAIEYLLIIGAAILVAAIVLIALGGALFEGNTQQTSSQQSYAASIDPLKKTQLLETGQLHINFPITSGNLGQPITRASGSPITDQASLEQAIQNGELVIQIGTQTGSTTPVSSIQTGYSSNIITVTGCYGDYFLGPGATTPSRSYGAKGILYSGTTTITTYPMKIAKLISVNNNPAHASLIGTIYQTNSTTT